VWGLSLNRKKKKKMGSKGEKETEIESKERQQRDTADGPIGAAREEGSFC
jgi:hypothetical protein